MPLVRIHRIVVDSMRSTKRCTTISAAGEHYVRAISPERTNTGYHVNVIVSRSARAVDRNENLARESAWIDSASKNQTTTHIDCCDLVKCRRNSRVLCVTRPNAPEAATGIPATNEKITIAGNVEGPPLRSVRNTDRRLPRGSVIGRATEPAKFAGGKLGPELILKTVTHTRRRPVNGEPFLVAAVRCTVGRLLCPRLSAVCGAPNVAAKCVYQQTQIEKIPGIVGVRHRIASENLVLQNAWEMPGHTSISAVAVTGLPKIRLICIELSPTDRDLIPVRWVN